MKWNQFTSLGISFLILIFINHDTYAQSSGQQFKKLSCPEKLWVIFHPFIAKKTFMLTQAAREVAKTALNDSLLDKDESGGLADAFRHSYWMALLSQNISWRKARCLGKAHEKGNYRDYKMRRMEEGILPDSVSCEMDLFNNMRGIEIGRVNKKVSAEELKTLIIIAIRNGQMKIISKDRSGNYLDCSNRVIDIIQWRGKWGIPKCLIHSNLK